MKITISAFSSSGGSYPVEFDATSGTLRVFCHCQAGMNQQMCKHKLALLKGDIKMLYDQTQTAVLQDVLNSPFYPPLKERLNDYESKLAEIEREVAKVREKEKVIKRDFVYELTFGKPAPQR